MARKKVSLDARIYDTDPLRYPFVWLRHYKVKRGRPEGTITSLYGKRVDLRVRVPERILVVLNQLAERRSISVGELVSGFCEAGIRVSELNSKLKKRRTIGKSKETKPPVPDGQRFDWTGIDSALPQEKKILDQDPSDTSVSEEP